MSILGTVKTPCIGVCSTGIGDSVCRGCKRFDYEVINWNAYSRAEKLAIDSRLSQLLSQVVEQRLLIVNERLMIEQIQHQQIRVLEHRPAPCQLYDLLKAGASQIQDPAIYGFQKKWFYRDEPLTRLREDIDREFHALSIAHFERFVLANASRARCVSNEVTGSR